MWYRRSPRGWDRYVIEKEFLTLEAGGAAFDIDGDGDPEITGSNMRTGTDSGGSAWERSAGGFGLANSNAAITLRS